MRNEIPKELSYPAEVDEKQLFYPAECSAEAPVFNCAAVLAMFGWENDDPGTPSLVTCSACFRRLGLWLFTQKVDAPEDEASMCRLDVVGEHRDVGSLFLVWYELLMWCSTARGLMRRARGVSRDGRQW